MDKSVADLRELKHEFLSFASYYSENQIRHLRKHQMYHQVWKLTFCSQTLPKVLRMSKITTLTSHPSLEVSEILSIIDRC